jgi:ubiquinone/menaquinone biosynthesis C-methylase UbiE
MRAYQMDSCFRRNDGLAVSLDDKMTNSIIHPAVGWCKLTRWIPAFAGMTGEQLRLMIQIAKRVQEQFTGFVDRQHQHPTGAIGRAIGERMVRQHAPETDWTIAELQITPEDRVLELGFGAGRGVALAAELAYLGRVVGIDLSSTMVQAARRRNRAAIEAGRVALLMGDVEALPFASEQFDKIFSIHTFYFWPEPLRIIEELSRILRPGGILMLTLSAGTTSPSGHRTNGPLQAILEQHVIPGLQQMGYVGASLQTGPDSRHYTHVAVVARK